MSATPPRTAEILVPGVGSISNEDAVTVLVKFAAMGSIDREEFHMELLLEQETSSPPGSTVEILTPGAGLI